MKIKIKPIISIRFFVILGIYLLIILGVLMLAKNTFNVSLLEAWQLALKGIKEESLFDFILLNIFPWALLFVVGSVIWGFIQKYRLNARRPRIIRISFEDKGVLLEYSLSRKPVFLPYNQTTFSVWVLITVGYNKYHQPVRQIDGVEMAFSAPAGDFSAQHRAGLSLIPKLLEEGKKFRSCLGKAKLTNGQTPSTQDEKDFIRFLREQMDNYRHYGLMLKTDPKQNPGFLILGLTTLIIPVIVITWLLQSFKQSNIFLSVSITAFAILMFTVSVLCFSKYIGCIRTARKLEKLKQGKN